MMGSPLWQEFNCRVLKRMYATVQQARRLVMIHSSRDVDESFDDLVAAGLSCFNLFQPKVMNITFLMPHYSGRPAFHGVP